MYHHHRLPSPPSPASSCAGSPSPLTPIHCFSPAPAIVTSDDFTMPGGSPDRSSISVLSPKSFEPSFMSSDDGRVRVFLRNKSRLEDIHDPLENSPPRTPLLSQDNASSRFSWDPTRSALLDGSRFPDSSRCSLLIQEVSLLVGLTSEHDHISTDGYSAVLDGPNQVANILPLTLTPTKSLAPRKHRNTDRSRPTSTASQPRPSNIATPSNLGSQPNFNIHDGKPALIGSADFMTPTPRHKCANADHPLLPASRRQGRVFNFKSPVDISSCSDALEPDKTFLDPREPPPKPTSNLMANRCSSLDRLECSLMKLETYSPYNHRKSQSDERAPVRAARRSDKRPSLPPPHRLKKPQSSHDFARRNASHPALPLGHPFPKQIPVRPCNTPRVHSVASLKHEEQALSLTPGSFMDMDITHAEEASQKCQEPTRPNVRREKIKGLVNVAKRVSRGVISWGKNLTGSTKPLSKVQDTVAVHESRF